tara:strand:+ start:208 stop:912 length:705 start_codon:yes stop_codon:yes gene_type:complete
LAKHDPKVRKISLKPQIDSDIAEDMVDNRKVKLFQTLLKKPKKSEIHLHSLKLFYEACLLLSGKYSADFIRDTKHTIHVDKNVRELIIDDKVYPVSQKKSMLSKLEPSRKNKIKIEFQERLVIENKDDIAFDHHGKEIDLSYSNTQKIIEKYPRKILSENDDSIKKPEITVDAAINKLISKLKKPTDKGIKSLDEKIEFSDILEVYVPIYEARLIGPKKKIKILRIDAVRKKIL